MDLKSRVFTLIALGLTLQATHAQMHMPAEATVTEIRGGLHVIRGAGGNIILSAGADGVFIVDDDMPPMAPKIEAAIATITDQPVRMIFNTHWHFDHTGGNEYFGQRGAIIVAHNNVRTRMSTAQFSRLMGSEIPPSPAAALPVITFDGEITFHLNGHTIKAMHSGKPAHTDGDAVLFFQEAGVVHMGDLFFNRMYPVIDLSAGGSLAGMIAAIDRLAPLIDPDMVIVPGHGDITDKAALLEFRAMLATVHDRISQLIGEGKSADDVVALQPTQEFDAGWAWSFMPPDRWTRLVYDSIADTEGPAASGHRH